MKNISHERWPEIVFGSSDSTISQAIRRAVHAGKLRKIAPRIYTSNLKEPLATIVARNAYLILGELYPRAIISHRSALEGGISKGSIFLTYKYTKKISLPGLNIYLQAGPPPEPNDTPFMDNLYMASRVRALLENMQQSRTLKKTLPREEIEALLDRLCRVYGQEELNLIRDQAKTLAKKLSLEKEFVKLNQIIGAIQGSKPIEILSTEATRARAKGAPYDSHRIELFGKLFSALKKIVLPVVDENISSTESLKNLAFFEAYFSNYIEGTEFAIEEAKDIIFYHKIMPERPEDAHDILATFEIVANTQEMNRTPLQKSDLITLLKKRHDILMQARPDKHPGKFKTISNRVGNLIFVAPELVEGTLSKGFAYYESLDIGLARAIFMMFLISEIHPFIDGNGRIARIMMNSELVAARQRRIIIPTVYREDYLLTLRRLSKEGDPDPYIRMLLRAQAFTASIDFSNYEQALDELTKSNAFMEPYEGKLIIRPK